MSTTTDLPTLIAEFRESVAKAKTAKEARLEFPVSEISRLLDVVEAEQQKHDVEREIDGHTMASLHKTNAHLRAALEQAADYSTLPDREWRHRIETIAIEALAVKQ